jgi:cold shock protein
MKGITKLGKQLMLVFLVLVAASTIFLSSPAIAAATDTIDTTSSPDRSNNKVSGVVKWYNDAKAYGVIQRHDNGKDVFVDYSGIIGYRTLEEGQEVEFEVQDGPKVPSAINVVIK